MDEAYSSSEGDLLKTKRQKRYIRHILFTKFWQNTVNMISTYPFNDMERIVFFKTLLYYLYPLSLGLPEIPFVPQGCPLTTPAYRLIV